MPERLSSEAEEREDCSRGDLDVDAVPALSAWAQREDELVIDELQVANLVDEQRLERGVEELRSVRAAVRSQRRTEMDCSQPTP